jgi:general secretion pathway protein G
MKDPLMSKTRKFLRKLKFTLMEMVVVIAIIALLASVVTPLYFRHVRKAKINTAKAQIVLIEQAVLDFRLEMNRLPTTLDELVKNTSGDQKWAGPYLKQAVPKDPWGHPYEYRCPGTGGEYDIISYGSDGQPGGSGEAADIDNYGEKN